MRKYLARAVLRLAPKTLREFVRDRLPPHWAARVATALSPSGKRLRFESRVRELESKLWGGFSERALQDLEAIESDGAAAPRDRSDAARTLACWFAAHDDLNLAYQKVVAMREYWPVASKRNVQVLLETECLCAFGRQAEATRLLAEALKRRPKDVHLELAMANTFPTDDQIRLDWINRSFLRSKFAPIRKRDQALPLTIDNLAVSAPPCSIPAAAQARVSVLIPAHAAESTLHLALDSLLAQTWQNLEVIVVDDCSTDRTFEVACEYAARDARVKALRTECNSGAYAARNLGLAAATGEFVTVHDADDWSHPQKIEVQASQLTNSKKSIANTTAWVRCSHDLTFGGTARPADHWVHLNTSSLMLRRQIVLDAGGWDQVRAAADTELRLRVEAAFGKARLPRLHGAVPLSFALESKRSLTRTGSTHVNTLYHGPRRAYREASKFWLDQAGPGLVRIPDPASKRAFPAPKALVYRTPAKTELDLLFIMDYGLRGGAFVSTFNYIEAALRMGKRVGVFQWKRYDLDVTRPPGPEIMKLAQDGAITMVTPGDEVVTEFVIVGYPVVLEYAIDLPPKIECQRFVIVTNQMAARLYSGGDVQYDPQHVSKNVERLFGAQALWVPISDLVRGLMIQDGRYGPIHTQTWTPLIDTSAWCGRPPRWLGGDGRKPVVGRHARDHYTKWPTNPEDVAAAYCADRPCEVRLLGGARVPARTLNRTPGNWHVHPFGSLPSKAFLETLDFYVHYPHEDYIEEFGRAVLEALAIGIPAILPPVFRPTFGTAAIYAEPSDVWPRIAELWADEQAYLERVAQGREFVMSNSDWSQFELRLANLPRP